MALPIVVVAVLAIVQVAVAMRDEIAVELAAREGARAAAVTTDMAGAATAAAHRAVDLPIEVSTSSDGTSVTVSVTYVDPTDIAIIGAFIAPITHRERHDGPRAAMTSRRSDRARSPLAGGKLSG